MLIEVIRGREGRKTGSAKEGKREGGAGGWDKGAKSDSRSTRIDGLNRRDQGHKSEREECKNGDHFELEIEETSEEGEEEWRRR